MESEMTISRELSFADSLEHALSTSRFSLNLSSTCFMAMVRIACLTVHRFLDPVSRTSVPAPAAGHGWDYPLRADLDRMQSVDKKTVWFDAGDIWGDVWRQVDIIRMYATVLNQAPDSSWIVGDSFELRCLAYQALALAQQWKVSQLEHTAANHGPSFGTATKWARENLFKPVAHWPQRWPDQFAKIPEFPITVRPSPLERAQVNLPAGPAPAADFGVTTDEVKTEPLLDIEKMYQVASFGSTGYSVRAASIGLHGDDPNNWPRQIKTNIGSRQPFQRTEVALWGARYTQIGNDQVWCRILTSKAIQLA